MNTIYNHEDYHALLATVLAHPDADMPRLVLADWLEENGEAERAEFIRLSCEIETAHRWCNGHCDPRLCASCRPFRRHEELWERNKCHWFGDRWAILLLPHEERDVLPNTTEAVVRRGFVAEVSAPLATLYGGECGWCSGGDRIADIRSARWEACPTCHGTGRTVGILPRLVRDQPVEVVKATDVTYELVQDRNEFCCLAGVFWRGGVGREGGLPAAVWDLLPGGQVYQEIGKAYQSDMEPDSALSAALLAWAKGVPA